jgi:hypothetical protein
MSVDPANDNDKSDDDYPVYWNRVYQDGQLIEAFPPVDWPGCRVVGCSFYNCTLDETLKW